MAPSVAQESALSSARRFVSGLRHDLFSRYRIMALKGFVDDSGGGGDSPWYVLAGYIGTVEAWDSFDAKWKAVMDADPPISYFHSSEAESLRPDGVWAGITEEQRDKKIDALIEVVTGCASFAVDVRVRQKHYDEVIKGNVPPDWDNAYYFLFLGFMIASTGIEKFFGNDEPIAFVFDRNKRFEKPSKNLYDQMLTIPRYRAIAKVDYEDDKHFLPLQAADLLAWQARRRYCVTTEPRRAHYDAARKCVRPPYSHIMRKDQLHELLLGMENRARRLADLLGVPMDVVQPWKNKAWKNKKGRTP